MMDQSLIKKLKINPDTEGLVFNQPAGYEKMLGNPATQLTTRKSYAWISAFVKNKKELEMLAIKIVQRLKDNGILWISYPKKNSGIETDVSRDYGWDALTKLGFEIVSLVAIDDTWSALRFKRTQAMIKKSATKKNESRQKFKAVLEKPDDGMDTAFVSIPFDVEKAYGTKGQVKVKAWFDNYPYRGILANMGTGCHVILVRKDVRKAIGKSVGDEVVVEILKDVEERVIDIPADLDKVLAKSSKAKSFFETLSYTNRKEYILWISSAKKEETRQKRLQETINKLLKGFKNPADKG
jgi:hypothetical protein